MQAARVLIGLLHSILRSLTLENFGGHGTAEDLYWFGSTSFTPAGVESFAMEWRSDTYKNLVLVLTA